MNKELVFLCCCCFVFILTFGKPHSVTVECLEFRRGEVCYEITAGINEHGIGFWI